LEAGTPFSRLELLVGPRTMGRLREARVILFGLGGVGSWCAEALVRNGVGHLAMVDPDIVSPSNVNRQLVATAANIGQPKAEAMAARLALVNPEAEVTALRLAYGPGTAEEVALCEYDYVLDAIDTLNNKVELLERAMGSGAVLFCSLGASRKLDPTRVRVGPFWEVRGCPLGKHLRKRLRNRGATADFLCVHSDENLANLGTDAADDDHAQANGSAVHVTATFGMALAGLVVDHVAGRISPSGRSR
jgi:tRNA A37 threonylcarbamoyladenosine dehydratase